jgi:hypothetical protein
MPQWGRPSGARIGRSNGRLARRVEELDAGGAGDGDGGVGNGNGERIYIDLTGSDQDDHLDDDGGEYELHSSSSDPTMAYAMQLALRNDDEWHLERALEKIRQARRQGRSAVNLSKRERDALERSRLQSERDQQRQTMIGNRRVSAPSSPQSQRRMSDAAFSSARHAQQMRSRTPSTQNNYAQSPQMHQPIPHGADHVPQWLPPPMPPPDSFISPYMSASFIPYDAHYASAMHHHAMHPPPLDGAYHPMHFAPSAGSSLVQLATQPSTPQPAVAVPSQPDSARPNSSGSSSSDNGVRIAAPPAETTAPSPVGLERKKKSATTASGSAGRGRGQQKRKSSLR